MCNKNTPDAAAEAIRTLMHALIDISVIADRAHKHATSETEYAGAFVPHSLAVMQLSADMALNEAGKIIMAACKNGGVVMRDIYNDTIDHASLALIHSENMLEILRIWLETLGDNERDKQKSRIATALITLLKPVINELQEIDLLHDRYKEQHIGE